MKMKKVLPLIGAVLAALVGIGRGFGGLTLIANPAGAVEVIVGIVLLCIGLWLAVAGISYIIKPTTAKKKSVTAAVILFWIDGIVNGFLLFGAPQVSGQIVNIVAVLSILACLWLPARR